jgi:hypothetical protein
MPQGNKMTTEKGTQGQMFPEQREVDWSTLTREKPAGVYWAKSYKGTLVCIDSGLTHALSGFAKTTYEGAYTLAKVKLKAKEFLELYEQVFYFDGRSYLELQFLEPYLDVGKRTIRLTPYAKVPSNAC